MSAFRLLDPFEVFLGDDAKPLAGGRFDFTEAGTTDPKDVFGDRALTVNNGASIGIDSTGRAVHPVWGEGAYRVRLYDADGVLQAEADWIEIPGGEGATIPALVDGLYLTNNGSVLQWGAVRQLPDPTGQDGKMLVADGDGYILQPQPTAPEIPDPEIVVTPTTFRAGVSDNTSKLYVQIGNATVTPNGQRDQVASVVFPEPFAAAPFVSLSPTSQSNAGGPMCWELTSVSATGFTAEWTIAAGAGVDAKILNAVPYAWRAEGRVNVS